MALTTFIGHHYQTDHTRRQIRRYRGKADDVVDVVTTDGYLFNEALIITQQRVNLVKQDMRTRTRRPHHRLCCEEHLLRHATCFARWQT